MASPRRMTLPKALRDKLGVTRGGTLHFTVDQECVRVRQPRAPNRHGAGEISDIFAICTVLGCARTLAVIEDGIAAGQSRANTGGGDRSQDGIDANLQDAVPLPAGRPQGDRS